MRKKETSGAQKSPKSPHNRPTSSTVQWDGRSYPLHLEAAGWRLRSKAKGRECNYRTGTTRLDLAKTRAKDWLERRADDPVTSRRGGGTLEALAAVYIATPKRTKEQVGRNNISRLRAICRKSLDRELKEVTCREVGPELWERFQRQMFKDDGDPFDLATRRPENVRINAAVRAARTLFQPTLLAVYRRDGLDVRPDAAAATMLPVPYLPPSTVAVSELVKAWGKLATGSQLWGTVGLAMFAGLRRGEISAATGAWIETHDSGVFISLRDRPEQGWWSKTGKPYLARVIDPALAAWLQSREGDAEPLVADPDEDLSRERWFEREPQKWLAKNGVAAGKPLHRLRGIYADSLRRLTEDAVTARLAGIAAAQQSLGHSSSETTENHYLTPDALR